MSLFAFWYQMVHDVERGLHLPWWKKAIFELTGALGPMIAWPRKLTGQAAAREATPVQPEMPRSSWEQRGQYVFSKGLGGAKSQVECVGES